ILRFCGLRCGFCSPLPVDASPTDLSPGYMADSDPDEDPKEDPKKDHADYPADGGDSEDEPSDDDDDDDDTNDEAGDTEVFETDESAPTPRSPQIRIPFAQTRLRRARKTVILESPMSPSMEARIAEYAAAPTPPSPLSPWTSPLPQIPSPPLPPPPSSIHLPPFVPTSLPLPSSPLPPLPASLFIPPPVDRREDVPEAELPHRKRLCLTAPTSRYEVGESLTTAPRPTGGHRVYYGFIGTMDAEIRRQRAEEVGYGIWDAWVDPTETVEEDIYAMIEDAQDRQTQLSQRVDVLIEDRQFHYETALQLDQEALASQEAWAHSGQLSAALGQIRALQARDQTHADDPEGAGSSA
ncbi:hypothetical protein Tco_1275340, partial [Tanacetum coccineum]